MGLGIDLNPTQLLDISTRLATAFATGGQSELLRLAVDLGDDVIAQVTAEMDLPAPAREILQAAYLNGFTD